MSTVPKKVSELVTWAELHAETWSVVAAQIGLTPAQATAFSEAAGAARTDFNARQAALDAYKSASTTSADSVRDLRRSAADMLRFIKAYAQTQPRPGDVYAAAQIPPPAPPGPVGPPGTPFDFKAVLNPSGSLTIKWKCNNPAGASGTVYTVRRKLGTEPSFSIIGAVGTRTFEDQTLPGGQTSVQYTVIAQRATQVGLMSSPFTVQFGFGGGGGFGITAQFEENGGGAGVKMAA